MKVIIRRDKQTKKIIATIKERAKDQATRPTTIFALRV